MRKLILTEKIISLVSKPIIVEPGCGPEIGPGIGLPDSPHLYCYVCIESLRKNASAAGSGGWVVVVVVKSDRLS